MPGNLKKNAPGCNCCFFCPDSPCGDAYEFSAVVEGLVDTDAGDGLDYEALNKSYIMPLTNFGECRWDGFIYTEAIGGFSLVRLYLQLDGKVQYDNVLDEFFVPAATWEVGQLPADPRQNSNQYTFTASTANCESDFTKQFSLATAFSGASGVNATSATITFTVKWTGTN